MNISVFDVIGPIMIGPSSSHTAGAARLARVAAQICAKPFYKVAFGLSGSFAKTGAGHGTDKALLAGAMGFLEDDERIVEAYEIAQKKNLQYRFYEVELNENYENSCKITFYHTDATKSIIVGSSIGGGRIVVTKINGMPTELSADRPTIIIHQLDQRGVISSVTQLLTWQGINIAVMRLSREGRGQMATTIIETDDIVPTHLKDLLVQLDGVKDALVLNFNNSVDTVSADTYESNTDLLNSASDLHSDDEETLNAEVNGDV
jgi:L-serine dehydratase